MARALASVQPRPMGRLPLLFLALSAGCAPDETGGFRGGRAEGGRLQLELPRAPERVAVWGCQRPVRIRFGEGAWQAMSLVEEGLWVWRGPPLSRWLELDVEGTVRVAWSAEDETGPLLVEVPSLDEPVTRDWVSRSGWGARPARCTSPDEASGAVVHHTADTSFSGASSMRALQAFHQEGRGWCDIGYHFVIDQEGRVYEGRPLGTLGAHASGANRGRLGIALAGCFDPSCANEQAVTDPAWDALVRLWLGLGLERAEAHRSLSATRCPGEALLNRWAADSMLRPNAWPGLPPLRSLGD